MVNVLAQWNAGDSLPTVVGGVTLDSSGTGFLPFNGSCLLMTQVASTGCTTKHTLSSTSNQVGVRAYFITPSAFSASAHSLVNVFDAGFSSQEVRAYMAGTGNPGQARLLNSAGTAVASSANSILAVSTKYRLELLADKTNSLARLALFKLGSDVAIYDTGDQTAASATIFGAVALGNFQTTPTVGVMRFTSMTATDTYALVGRHNNDQPLSRPAVLNRAALVRASTF